MHAHAHHDRDPIYAGIRALRMTREGEEVADACARCHTPRRDRGKKAARAGVGCAACHNLSAPDGTLRGPHDIPPGVTPAHGTGPAAPQLTDGTTICMACHETMHNTAGVPICTTGDPSERPANADKTCADCHMPLVDGPSGAMTKRQTHRSHRFPGPHRAWYQDDRTPLEQAVSLKGRLAGTTLELELSNRTGHAFPTGFPGRQAILTVEGTDADGRRMWAPDSIVRGKRYEDADGKPTLAPWATRLVKDTRLKYDETRSIRRLVPPAARSVTVTLEMRLLPPPLAARIGLADAKESRPVTIERLTLERAAAPAVRIDGTLHGVHALGMTDAIVQLADVVRPGVYGLGALAGLAGEVTILDGEVVLARANGGLSVVSRTHSPKDGAALLVSAQVPRWRTFEIAADVSPDGVEALVEDLAAKAGLDTTRPFPFLIVGRLGPVQWHVVDPTNQNETRPGLTGCQAHAASGVRGEFEGGGTAIGFYSTNHGGVFTPPDRRVHVHFAADGEDVSGHVDALAVPRGAVVHLPSPQ